MNIEKATKNSLNEIHEIVTKSIVNLCAVDHLNESEKIEHWLSARSVKKLEKLLFDGDSQGFVCIDNERVIGVSHIKTDGEITLCYVHFDHAGRGVGRLILKAAEDQAKIWGLEELKLKSTATARNFYRYHGFEQYRDPVSYFGMPGYPLKKLITVT